MTAYARVTTPEALRKPQVIKAHDKLATLAAGMAPDEWITTCCQAFNIIDTHGSFPMRVTATEAMQECERLSKAARLAPYYPEG